MFGSSISEDYLYSVAPVATFLSAPDTFIVEEIPAYLPSGTGTHTYVFVEKHDLTTPEMVRRLAQALGVRDRDMGYAGLKDRHATTRQWVSIPDVPLETARAAVVEGARVLRAELHGNKLRTGHLRGNRFEVVLADVAPGEEVVLAESFAALLLSGLPNRYGAQRFGAAGDNVQRGVAILRGTLRERNDKLRRLMLSAVQSAVFNRALELRAERGGLRKVLQGDVMQKVGSGGLFVTTDPALDQLRVDAGEIIPTAPMPGGRETSPPPGTEAHRLEEEAAAAIGLTLGEFAQVGRDLPGARRPVVVALSDSTAPQTEPTDKLRLRFGLPPGSYATVLLDALADAASRRCGGAAVLTFPSPPRPSSSNPLPSTHAPR